MPVLPLVASITVWPGFSAPDFSAASMTPIARRSLTDPSGLKAAALAYRFTPAGARRLMRTTGVLPIVSRMLAYRFVMAFPRGCPESGWYDPLGRLVREPFSLGKPRSGQRSRARLARRPHRHAHLQPPRGAQRDDLGDVPAALYGLRGGRRRRDDPRTRPEGPRRQALRRGYRHQPVHAIQGRGGRAQVRGGRRQARRAYLPRQET